ncbi:autotransporter outer membrane beta-barrel domain-containing protein, partial [Rhodonellum psychrophilum]
MNLIDINIQKFFKNKEQKTLTTSNSNNSGIILSQLENKVDRWEDWDGDLKVLGKTYSDNFLFSTDEDIDGESGTGGTGGGSITGLSFTGRTLTLSQTSLANLTATFNLIENDIPSLSISKINGLQNALESSSYVHPAKLWTNKAELTGASVISNIIVDALGHPTDWETRIITPASIGAEATLIKSNIVQGDGISLSGSLINKLIGSGSATFSVDNTVIRTFGNQTINGVKTFTENVIAKNLIFSLADNVEGGSTGTGGNVTGISFTGKTLTLTQTNLANLTATFSLIESDIPTLQISKISGLQTALNNATYVHPSKNWVDKTALTGANVISNISIDSLGHPTNWTTRTLTASNIGAEPTLVKSNIIQGDGLTLTGSLVNKLIGSGNITFSLDGTVIRNFGNQTIGGLKTFTENVIGKNFIFSLNEDVEGGSSGIGGNVTGLSFSGKTLTLSQSNLANLTASFSLIESDIPSLSISKTTGLQDALNAKSNTNHIHQYNDIQNKPDLNNTVNLIDININSLNGIGTIESQVATYINANQNVVRNLTSSKLYIRLIGTNPTPTPATPTPTPTATPVPTATPTVTATPT